jgi:hypothetical protein
MFDCEECLRREPAEPGVDCDPFGSVLSTQLRQAQHMARRRKANIPGPEAGCRRCVAGDVEGGRVPRELSPEHRARHLIVPPSIVGGF